MGCSILFVAPFTSFALLLEDFSTLVPPRHLLVIVDESNVSLPVSLDLVTKVANSSKPSAFCHVKIVLINIDLRY